MSDETEAWLERFQPRRPRPELRGEILALCANPPPSRRIPWVGIGAALCVLAAIALTLLVEADSRRRLDAASGPRVPSRAARDADDLLHSIGLDRDRVVRERAVAAFSTQRSQVLRPRDLAFTR